MAYMDGFKQAYQTPKYPVSLGGGNPAYLAGIPDLAQTLPLSYKGMAHYGPGGSQQSFGSGSVGGLPASPVGVTLNGGGAGAVGGFGPDFGSWGGFGNALSDVGNSLKGGFKSMFNMDQDSKSKPVGGSLASDLFAGLSAWGNYSLGKEQLALAKDAAEQSRIMNGANLRGAQQSFNTQTLNAYNDQRAANRQSTMGMDTPEGQAYLKTYGV